MNKNLLEIQKNFKDYNQFVNWFTKKSYIDKPIESCDRWELREALSFYPTRQSNKTEVFRHIIKAIRNNVNYDWADQNFNLLDEAVLQTLLRDQGYEIDGIDQWPTNCLEFKQHLKSLKFLPKCKNLFYSILYKILSPTYTYFFIILNLVGLLYFNNWSLLITSLIVGYLLWALLEIAQHDYLQHRYIEPKNIVLKYIIDLLLYVFSPNTYSLFFYEVKLHILHHQKWKTEDDLFTQIMKKGFFYGIKTFNIFRKPLASELEKLIKQYKTHQWIFRYLREIEIFLSVLFILIFGLEYYFYLFLFPILIKTCLDGQHDWYLIRFGERNYWFLWPLALNQSWHVDHHINFNKKLSSIEDIFQGPHWIRYINPQYYFAKMCFKLTGLSS